MMIREAPIFTPTEAEWSNSDPISYIEKVALISGLTSGIIKILPPPSWRPPPSRLSSPVLRFQTRVQMTTRLDGPSRVDSLLYLQARKTRFVSGKASFSRTEAIKEQKEACCLFRYVESKGGVELMKREDWINAPNEANSLGLSPEELKAHYDVVWRSDQGPQEDDALDDDDNNRNGDVEMMTSNGDMDACEGLRLAEMIHGVAEWGRGKGEECARVALNVMNKKRMIVVVPDLSQDDMDSFRLRRRDHPPPPPRVGATFWKYFSSTKCCYRGRVCAMVRGGGSASSSSSSNETAKWRVRYRSEDGAQQWEEEDSSSELSLLLACGSTKEEAEEGFLHGVCQKCNRANDPSTFLECDDCGYRYHVGCLSSGRSTRLGLRSLREERDWFCDDCVNPLIKSGGKDNNEEDEAPRLPVLVNPSPAARAVGLGVLSDFGFGDGDAYTTEEYSLHDDAVKRGILTAMKKSFLSETELEDAFWDATKGILPPGMKRFSTVYGNDLDTASVGSGFPTRGSSSEKRKLQEGSDHEDVGEDPYATSGWNLNNLPTAKGSLLQHVEADISGVIVPWLYIGMTWSAFCFHVEDHNFHSINYLHSGAPKSWWGVPASSADAFEAAARELAPELFEARPDLLQGIVTMFDPKELVARGVEVVHLVQRPGEFVITFPRAYHGGFNHGYNTAEAVNFAAPQWLPFGGQAVERYASFSKTPVIAHEALLLAVANQCVRNKEDASRIATYLIGPLLDVVDAEEQARAQAKERGFEFVSPVVVSPDPPLSREPADPSILENGGGGGGGRPRPIVRVARDRYASASSRVFNAVPRCATCRRYCPLSHAERRVGNRVISTRCLQHAEEGGDVLVELCTMNTLYDLVSKVALEASASAEWLERARRLFSGEKQPDDALGPNQAGGTPFPDDMRSPRRLAECAKTAAGAGTKMTKSVSAKVPIDAARALLSLGLELGLSTELGAMSNDVAKAEAWINTVDQALLNSNNNNSASAMMIRTTTTLEKARLLLDDYYSRLRVAPPPQDSLSRLEMQVKKTEEWAARARLALEEQVTCTTTAREEHLDRLAQLQQETGIFLTVEREHVQSVYERELWRVNAARYLSEIDARTKPLAFYESIQNLFTTNVPVDVNNEPEAMRLRKTFQEAQQLETFVVDLLAATSCNPDEVFSLQTSVAKCALVLPSAEALKKRVRAIESWKKRAMSGGEGKLSALQRLCEDRVYLRISSEFPLAARLDSCLERATRFQHDVAVMLSFVASSTTTTTTLPSSPSAILASSSATTILPTNSTNNKKDLNLILEKCINPDFFSIRKNGTTISDDADEFCVCRRPSREPMIMCDECHEWFHDTCIGMTPAEFKAFNSKKYICEGCSALRCVCRRVDNGDLLIQCEGKCEAWFHPRCVGLLDAQISSLPKFICPSCVEDPAEYVGNLGDQALRPLHCTCQQPSLRTSAVFVKCATCGLSFHSACLGFGQGLPPAWARDDFRCESCCAADDEPYLCGRWGYEAFYRMVRENTASLQKAMDKLGIRRVNLDAVDTLLTPLSDFRDDSIPLLRVLRNLAQPARDWEAFATKSWIACSGCGVSNSLLEAQGVKLWDHLMKAASLRVAPHDSYTSDMDAELLLRHLGKLVDPNAAPLRVSALRAFAKSTLLEKGKNSVARHKQSCPVAAQRLIDLDRIRDLVEWDKSFVAVQRKVQPDKRVGDDYARFLELVRIGPPPPLVLSEVAKKMVPTAMTTDSS